MLRMLTLAIVALSSGGLKGPADDGCGIPGNAVQWQADYCLYETGTDDLIAAQPCMDRERSLQFAGVCAKKAHYKRALCRLVIESGSRHGTIEECFDDPAFSGPVVGNDGI